MPCEHAPTALTEWIKDVHAHDRQQVEHALASVSAGEVVQFEYRIVRPADGSIRWLRDTSFPIPQDDGAVTRIGGIVEDVTQEDIRQVYIVSGKATDEDADWQPLFGDSGIAPGPSKAVPLFSTWPRCFLQAASLSICASPKTRGFRCRAS